jgi:hypothetical protein
MSLITVDSKVIGAVTADSRYIAAREEIDRLVKEHGLVIPDLPDMIRVLNVVPEIWEVIRQGHINVLSTENQGMRNGQQVYEARHSVPGVLSTVKRMRYLSDEGYCFVKISEPEWYADVPRVDLWDLRQGKAPIGKPHINELVIPEGYNLIPRKANMKKVLEAHNRGELIIFAQSQLTPEQYRLDDRVLALCDSPELVEATIKLLTDKGNSTIETNLRITEVGFDKNLGRPICFDYHGGGIYGDSGIHNDGRFCAVAPKVLSEARSACAKISSPAQPVQPEVAATYIN